jgi:toluene monooxygenase system protein E
MTKTRRTYWHLEGRHRVPSEYEIVSSHLLVYPQRGFEVRTPVTEWYERYQAGSPLRARDWERFRDPRETTYARYTELQKARETYVDGLFESIEATGYDAKLGEDWARQVGAMISALRYPAHGLQMVAAYTGSMAPCARIVIALAFQAADEVRRIQRFALRMRQLQETHPGAGDEGKSVWEHDDAWQPLRVLVENMLVVRDWGEAFVALNLVVKPAFDELFGARLGRLAAERGDEIFARIVASLAEDGAWQRAWSASLVQLMVEDVPENASVIRAWIEEWAPRARAAVQGFAPLFGPDIGQQVEAACRPAWTILGWVP